MWLRRQKLWAGWIQQKRSTQPGDAKGTGNTETTLLVKLVQDNMIGKLARTLTSPLETA